MSDTIRTNITPVSYQPLWRGWARTPSRYLGNPIWFHPRDGLAFEDVQLGVLIDLPAEAIAEAQAFLSQAGE
jgi:hypothetical protein